MFPKILLLIAILFLLVLLVRYLFYKQQLRRQENLPSPHPSVTTLIQSSPVTPGHSQDVRSLPVASPPPPEMPVQEINPRVDPRRHNAAPPPDDQAMPPTK